MFNLNFRQNFLKWIYVNQILLIVNASTTQNVCTIKWNVTRFCLQFITSTAQALMCCGHFGSEVRYTECSRRKGPNFGRVFLRSNYTDITQNTYIKSSMVREILARKKFGLRWFLRTLLCPWRHTRICLTCNATIMQ